MSNMEIREYTTADKEKLDIFNELAWTSADEEHYRDVEPDFYKKEVVLVAFEGEMIVGYGAMKIDTGVAQIEPLIVLRECKGKGIGSALLSEAEARAKETSVHKVWLETGADWKAKDFYLKHGYVVRAELPNHIGGQTFLLMDKMI
ncbi:GNAT family N-acetyltransferase [Candidatus Nomurabacteria bacterium]|nr:GNAT family N-acetyltransferase [Candidatus Nomurabacteria bacterium]